MLTTLENLKKARYTPLVVWLILIRYDQICRLAERGTDDWETLICVKADIDTAIRHLPVMEQAIVRSIISIYDAHSRNLYSDTAVLILASRYANAVEQARQSYISAYFARERRRRKQAEAAGETYIATIRDNSNAAVMRWLIMYICRKMSKYLLDQNSEQRDRRTVRVINLPDEQDDEWKFIEKAA